MLASSATSQGSTISAPTLSASGTHALLQRLALIGEGHFRALRGGAGRGDAPGDAMRSLATPMSLSAGRA
jgi:hypothetical protein